MNQYDVAIIGAGPAGSSCAWHLASQNVRVLLLERASFPRFKPCGGAIPRRIIEEYPFFSPGRLALQELKEVSYSYQGTRKCERSTSEVKVYSIERMEFDHLFCQEACAQGAQLREKTRALALTEHAQGVEVRLSHGESITANFALLACGAFSSLRNSLQDLRRGPRNFGSTSLLHVRPSPGSGYLHRAHIDFAFIKDGYAGVISKKDYLVICLYSTHLLARHLLRQKTMDFLASAGIEGNSEFFTIVPMELYNGKRRLNTKRILLAGDAADLVDPLSGEGIRHAIHSGAIASQVLSKLLAGQGSPDDYSQRIHHEIGRELALAKAFSWLAHRIPEITYGGLINVSEEAADVLNGSLSYRSLSVRLKKRLLRMAGSLFSIKRHTGQ